MTFALLFVVDPPLLALLTFLPPLWAALVLSGPLVRLTKPTFRADLAVTPTQPRQFLARELRIRLVVAMVPFLLWSVGLGIDTIVKNVFDQSFSDEWYFPLVIFVFVLLTVPILSSTTATASMLASARRACVRKAEMNSIRPILRAFGVGILWVVVFWAAGFGEEFLLNQFHKKFGLIALCILVAITIAAAAAMARFEWNRLAAAYLVIDS